LNRKFLFKKFVILENKKLIQSRHFIFQTECRVTRISFKSLPCPLKEKLNGKIGIVKTALPSFLETPSNLEKN
jgi:hypothetical protein